MKKHLGRRHDPSRGSYDVNNVEAAREEHVYLFSTTDNGVELLWEADLIGDLSNDEGHGKLPPVVHMECPFCTTPEDRRAVTIDKINKGYEIEPLKKPIKKPVSGPLGQTEVAITKVLHVREKLRCPYCQTTFVIRGSRIQKVG